MMSDWLMKPRNSIEEKLQAMGYRVYQEYHCGFVANAPDGGLIAVDNRNQDNCWTACYQHQKDCETEFDEWLAEQVDNAEKELEHHSPGTPNSTIAKTEYQTLVRILRKRNQFMKPQSE